MNFALEPFHEISAYVEEKTPEHRDEAHGREGHEKLNLDWEYYFLASYRGKCVAVTAREDGKLVGYSVFFIELNANHKHILEAVNSGFFLEKQYRGRASFEFIKAADQLLKGLGVHTINYLLKDDRIGKLLARNGYAPEMKLWSIKL